MSNHQIEDDAARWRYVRDHLTQMRDAKMNGQHYWSFRNPRETGTTIDAVIDKLIRRMAAEQVEEVLNRKKERQE